MKKTNIFILIALSMVLFTGCQSEVINEKEVDSPVQKNKTKTTIKKSKTKKQVKQMYQPGDLLDAVTENQLQRVKKIVAQPEYDLNEVNENGETPLLIAVHKNDVDIANLLLIKGADMNHQDKISDSPYLYAAAEGRTEILKEMLKGKPNFQLTNRYGGNGLIPAAEKGHVENVRLLLEDGRENVNHINRLGWTALLETVYFNDGSEDYQKITQLLVDHDADISIKDSQGFTALDYAKQKHFSEIVAILTQAK